MYFSISNLISGLMTGRKLIQERLSSHYYYWIVICLKFTLQTQKFSLYFLTVNRLGKLVIYVTFTWKVMSFKVHLEMSGPLRKRIAVSSRQFRDLMYSNGLHSKTKTVSTPFTGTD